MRYSHWIEATLFSKVVITNGGISFPPTRAIGGCSTHPKHLLTLVFCDTVTWIQCDQSLPQWWLRFPTTPTGKGCEK